MIPRDIEPTIRERATQFAAVAVLGPRQSGKTTLVKNVFSKHGYVSLEDFDRQHQAKIDPRGFLERFSTKNGIILDEIQHAPHLLSYIQTIIDEENKKGFFIVTGSQNLLVNQAVTQTLAGRIAMLTLFPFSTSELKHADLLSKNIEETVVKGTYPRLYHESIPHDVLYPHYIRGYIERDVRQIKKVLDLGTFQKFMRLCAGRTGQLLNISSLCNSCDIDNKTAHSWLSLLAASYIIFLLQPYYKNFGKRLVKSPKLYFVDTGLACSLLNITTSEKLESHYLRGELIESFLISDLFKQFANIDKPATLYFWRDITGNEIDAIVEKASSLIPLEIKGGKTVNTDYFKNFTQLIKIKQTEIEKGFVVYSGQGRQVWPMATVVGWQESGTLIKEILSE